MAKAWSIEVTGKRIASVWGHTGTLSPELFPKRDSYIQRRRDLNSAKPPVKDQHILFTRDTCIHPASFNRHDLLESKFSGYFTIFFENFMIIENYIILMILVDFIFFWFCNTIKIVEFYDFCFWDLLIS